MLDLCSDIPILTVLQNGSDIAPVCMAMAVRVDLIPFSSLRIASSVVIVLGKIEYA